MKTIDELTEKEAKDLLHKIADILSIGEDARTPSVILTNITNASRDEFCEYRRAIEYLDETILRFIRPGYIPDKKGKTLLEAVERAMDEEDSVEVEK